MKIFKKSLAASLSTLLVLSLMIPFLATAAQRTNNVLTDQAPQIDASGNAVWVAKDGTSEADTEVYFWNGTAVVQLTSNTIDEASPQIEGGVTTWLATDEGTGTEGTDDEVYYNSNGLAAGTTQLTTDGVATDLDDGAPQITTNSAGAKVVTWIREDGTDNEVYTSTNGGAATALTADATGAGTVNDDSSVQTAGNYIIYLKTDGTRNDVYLYNGTTTTQLTTNNASNLTESSPVVDSTGKAAWLSGVGTGTTYTDTPEIQYYNGTTTVALTSNGVTESDLGIDSGKVVWTVSDGHDNEVFFNSTGVASATKRLTTNGMDDDNPSISGSFVVWEGDRRGDNATIATSDANAEDYDIMLYDTRDATTYQVNNDSNDQFNPVINTNNVAWLGFDGSDDEVFTDVVRSTTLSLKASPTSIKKGKSTTLSGTLKDSAGNILASKKISIKSGSTVIKTATTNSSGKFSVKIKPSRTRTYKAFFAGRGTNLKKTSKGKKVTVK